ncbi:amidase [Oleispirillum naphthae]|uniref:amidase n=1 Tax=Oleispirillum naphthae TaxID=2838853 RepID=UPI0030825428
MFVDLRAFAQLRRALADGTATAESLVREALARAAGEAGRIVFTEVFAPQAQAEARAADLYRAAGVATGPLAGLPVSVKDLFDVAGHVTRAGSRALADAPAAAADAPAVARLRAAGAVIVGHTNMTEFAFSGLGINPHYGTPPNPWDAARIPGGSSSGAAVSVALGMAAAALGTDTGGSVRIPAAFCGLVGFKPTAARSDIHGVVPLSPSLDSVGPIARSVADCALIDAMLVGGAVPRLAPPPLAGLRFALPQAYVLDGLDDGVAKAFGRALSALSGLGARLEEVPFAHLSAIPELLAGGGLVAAESYAWHRALLAEKRALYDPRVAVRIDRGAAISAADYLDLQALRAVRIAEMDAAMEPFDAVLMPTVACVAPRLADLAEDAAYTRVNALALRNTTVGNLLDLCAVSLPCQQPGDLPVGLSVVGRRGSDRATLSFAAAVEGALCGAGLGRPMMQQA